MGKQIKLPGGVLFDPEAGVIQGGSFGAPPISLGGSSRSHRASAYTRRHNLWERFDSFISAIGDWFAVNLESITNYCALGLFVLAWIGFGISILSLWASEGFIWALVAGIFGGGIFYYISMVAIGILIWVANIVLAMIRFLFYNAYTFLIAVLLIGGICAYSWANIPESRTMSTSAPVTLQPNYYCNVNTILNVREQPSSNARLLGHLKRHEDVYVYAIDNNFAKIAFQGGIAYVNADYLELKVGSIAVGTD